MDLDKPYIVIAKELIPLTLQYWPYFYKHGKVFLIGDS